MFGFNIRVSMFGCTLVTWLLKSYRNRLHESKVQSSENLTLFSHVDNILHNSLLFKVPNKKCPRGKVQNIPKVWKKIGVRECQSVVLCITSGVWKCEWYSPTTPQGAADHQVEKKRISVSLSPGWKARHLFHRRNPPQEQFSIQKNKNPWPVNRQGQKSNSNIHYAVLTIIRN